MASLACSGQFMNELKPMQCLHSGAVLLYRKIVVLKQLNCTQAPVTKGSSCVALVSLYCCSLLEYFSRVTLCAPSPSAMQLGKRVQKRRERIIVYFPTVTSNNEWKTCCTESQLSVTMCVHCHGQNNEMSFCVPSCAWGKYCFVLEQWCISLV